MFNFFVNRNWKKLADSRKRAKILADNRKCHHPIETLIQGFSLQLKNGWLELLELVALFLFKTGTCDAKNS